MSLPFEFDNDILNVMVYDWLSDRTSSEIRKKHGEDKKRASEEAAERVLAIRADFRHVDSDVLNASYKTCIFEHKPSGRFFEFQYYYDSWDGGDDINLDANGLTEVFPVEKTVIVYEARK